MMKLINKNVYLSTSYSDGTFVFTDISDGKLQVGTGALSLGNGFVSSTSYAGVANIPSSFGDKTITIISQYSLGNTQGLTIVQIPATIEEIHQSAFGLDINIQFIIFEPQSSLRSIGNYAFRNIHMIDTIFIPSSVETIGTYAFADCTKIKNFYYCGNSNLQNIDNCFTNSDLVTHVFVSFSYSYSAFASKPITQISICPSSYPHLATPTPLFSRLSHDLHYSYHLMEIIIPLSSLLTIAK